MKEIENYKSLQFKIIELTKIRGNNITTKPKCIYIVLMTSNHHYLHVTAKLKTDLSFFEITSWVLRTLKRAHLINQV